MGKHDDLREMVIAELNYDPKLDASGITVETLRNGTVWLNGTVTTYPQFREAATAAQRVAGVRTVHNHVEVVLVPGAFRDDAQLTTAANDALAMDVTVPDTIEAWAKNGKITLTGSALHAAQRLAAVDRVRGLTGVSNVFDDVRISDPQTLEDVVQRITEALDRSALVPDDSDVEVGLADSTVTLLGSVTTWAEHDAVVGAAWMASGVKDVRDQLTVTG